MKKQKKMVIEIQTVDAGGDAFCGYNCLFFWPGNNLVSCHLFHEKLTRGVFLNEYGVRVTGRKRCPKCKEVFGV